MAISVFQVQSPLSQVTRERTNEYLKTVGSAVGEELVRVDLDEFEKAPFALVFVASRAYLRKAMSAYAKSPAIYLPAAKATPLPPAWKYFPS
mgnify:CR=1 FL=1